MCIIIHAYYIHQHDKADLGYRSAWRIHIANSYIHFHRVKIKWLFVHFIKDLFDVMRQKDGSFLIEPITPWIELPVLHHWWIYDHWTTTSRSQSFILFYTASKSNCMGPNSPSLYSTVAHYIAELFSNCMHFYATAKADVTLPGLRERQFRELIL